MDLFWPNIFTPIFILVFGLIIHREVFSFKKFTLPELLYQFTISSFIFMNFVISYSFLNIGIAFYFFKN